MKKVTNENFIIANLLDDDGIPLPILDGPMQEVIEFEKTLEFGEIIDVHGILYVVVDAGQTWPRYQVI